jgi:hypothetical protein
VDWAKLVPRLVFYSFFFMGILGAEIAIIVIQVFFYGQTADIEIFYLITICNRHGAVPWRRDFAA